jgi:hypothetical protein
VIQPREIRTAVEAVVPRYVEGVSPVAASWLAITCANRTEGPDWAELSGGSE